MSAQPATIFACFWLNKTIDDALALYQDAFSTFVVESATRMPNSEQTLVAMVSVYGTSFQLLDGGPQYVPHHGLSLMVKFTDPEELTHAFTTLSAHGTVMMDLDSYPHSELYAWVADPFGVSWQLMLVQDKGSEAPSLTPCLMFGGANQDYAARALDHYVASFSSNPRTEDSHLSVKVMYPDAPDRVMFAHVELGSSELSAMDSAVEQSLEHTAGSSLVVLCEDQQEIDHFWDALCTNEKDSQCGWCVDQFGIHWQVIPHNLGELLSTPEANVAFRQMKKLDINALKQA